MQQIHDLRHLYWAFKNRNYNDQTYTEYLFRKHIVWYNIKRMFGFIKSYKPRTIDDGDLPF